MPSFRAVCNLIKRNHDKRRWDGNMETNPKSHWRVVLRAPCCIRAHPSATEFSLSPETRTESKAELWTEACHNDEDFADLSSIWRIGDKLLPQSTSFRNPFSRPNCGYSSQEGNSQPCHSPHPPPPPPPLRGNLR